jgi:putative ABC transport system ATP-binding protein
MATSLRNDEPTGADTIPAPVVAGDHLSRRFGEGDAAVDALKDVCVSFPRSTFTAVMGPSGSGKSTLMHILAGLDRPTSGTVQIDGTDITKLGDNDLTHLRRDKIGFVFQFFNLLPMLTAEENIVLPLKIGGKKIDEPYLNDLLHVMGIEDRRGHRPAQLSGGQQQRVAIARALITRPAVIFADEPTGNLDSSASAEVLHLLRQAVDSFGQTIVVVTHDATAASTADRIIFLSDGKIVRDTGKSSVDQILDVMKELQ